MLEKSFGLLFYLKKTKNYELGPIPVYLRITVDGIEGSLSTKRSWDPSRWNNNLTVRQATKRTVGRLMNTWMF